MKNTAIKLSGILLAGAVFFATLLGYGTQVAAATAGGSDTEAGQASGDGSVASVADLPGKHIGVQPVSYTHLQFRCAVRRLWRRI